MIVRDELVDSIPHGCAKTDALVRASDAAGDWTLHRLTPFRSRQPVRVAAEGVEESSRAFKLQIGSEPDSGFQTSQLELARSG